MSGDNAQQHGFVVQAFAKQDLDQGHWDNHFLNNIQPLLAQCYDKTAKQEDGQANSGIRLLAIDDVSGTASRVAMKTYSTSQPSTLQTCASLCKSRSFADMEVRSGIEHIIQPASLIATHRSTPGLAVFDMDSTLIQQEVIDELARAVGLYSEVAAITEAAMRGEAPYTDFEASLRARVSLLKGVPVSIWDELRTSTITFTTGARELVQALKALGWKTAVLSGGFAPLANWVKDSLGLDYAYANHLVTNEKQAILTGELVPGQPIIHAEKKRELLREIAAKEGIPVECAVAVGDGSNDLLMMSAAGLGIAFHAKAKVQLAAPVRLNSTSLLDVMHILGYTKREIDNLLSKKTA